MPGGELNVAGGNYSVAAGLRAHADHAGAFVWADSSTSNAFSSSAANQFLIQASGGVGINTANPNKPLSVRGEGTDSELIGLKNNADSLKWYVNLKSSGLNFAESGVADFRLFLQEGGNVGIGTGDPQGTLDVNGPIMQRGGDLHADYVFEDDYPLESIEEHSESMWREKHLPAVGPGQKDDQGREYVEYGARLWGILEELEKAHIYIELLHNRNNSLERELWNVRQVVSELVEKAGR